jgi:hypothetical protein
MKTNHVQSHLVFIMPVSQLGIRASKAVEQLITSQKRPQFQRTRSKADKLKKLPI